MLGTRGNYKKKNRNQKVLEGIKWEEIKRGTKKKSKSRNCVGM